MGMKQRRYASSQKGYDAAFAVIFNVKYIGVNFELCNVCNLLGFFDRRKSKIYCFLNLLLLYHKTSQCMFIFILCVILYNLVVFPNPTTFSNPKLLISISKHIYFCHCSTYIHIFFLCTKIDKTCLQSPKIIICSICFNSICYQGDHDEKFDYKMFG